MKNTGHQTEARTDRLWHLDLLRILAVFAVVLLHASPQGYIEVTVGSAPWQVMNALSSLCVWAVPMMFMISGALFLSPEKPLSTRRLYRKNLLRIVTSFCFWSAFYALVYCTLTGKGKWTFLNQFLRGHYHMWFLFAMIGLYCITPLLRQIAASRRAVEYLLLAGLVLTFLPARLLGFASLFTLPHADVLQSLQSAFAQMNPYRSLSCVYYYVLGYYLNTTIFSKRKKLLLLGAGMAALLATFALTAWQSMRVGETSSHFYANDSINVLLMASAIFVLFKELTARFLRGERAKALVLHLSRYSFGVYLIHPFLIERISFAFPTASLGLAVSILGVASGVYLLSCAVSCALNHGPILRRFIV